MLCENSQPSKRPSSSGHWKPLAPASDFLVEGIHTVHQATGVCKSEPDFPDPRQSNRGHVREKNVASLMGKRCGERSRPERSRHSQSLATAPIARGVAEFLGEAGVAGRCGLL
jgi:hypothetical protein